MFQLFDGPFWDYGFHVEYSENSFWKQPKARSHFHKVYEIYYLVENEVIYFIDEKAYLVKPGMVIVVPPNHNHLMFPVNENSRKRYLIYLPEEFAQDSLQNVPDLLRKFSNKAFSVGPNEKYIEQLFNELLNEYKNGNTLLQKSLLDEILVALNNVFDNGSQSFSEMGTQDNLSEPMSSIVKYISEHYSENITLGTLSEKFYLHPAYISRLFKQKLNISFSCFLRNIRISKVMFLLKESDYSINQIAQKTGFDSSTTLCRFFKRNVGLSPLQYRKYYKNALAK